MNFAQISALINKAIGIAGAVAATTGYLTSGQVSTATTGIEGLFAAGATLYSLYKTMTTHTVSATVERAKELTGNPSIVSSDVAGRSNR